MRRIVQQVLLSSVLLVVLPVAVGGVALSGGPVSAAGDAVPVGDNVIADGIPGVPLELARIVDRYGEYRTARFAAWHPQRVEMLVQTRFGNTTQVHRVAAPGGRRTQLTFFPEPVLSVSAWATKADREFVTLSMDVGGNEFYQLYALDTATRQLTLLSDGKKRNGGAVYSEANGMLAYARTDADSEGAFTEIRTVDPLDPSTDRLVVRRRGGGWQPTDWSPQRDKLLALEYVSINDSRVWEIDSQSGRMRRLAPETTDAEVPAAHRSPQFASPRKGVVFTSDEGSEFQQLIHVVDNRRRVLSQDSPWDVESVDVSPNGRHVAYATNEGGRSVLHVVAIASGNLLDLPAVPVGVMSGLDWHNDSRHLAFSLSSAAIAGDVFVVDLEDRSLQRWTYSESAIDTDAFAEPELIEWESFDGRKISGFLYRPPPRFAGRRPVIVSIHGGPESQTRPRYLGRMNYFLNELGIAIVYPNVRGSRGYGKSFLKLDNGLLREGTHRDISALLDWVGSRDDLDADRIMVRGGSYGGYMTLSAAYRFSERIACAVDVVGISNLRTFLENTQGYRRDLRRVEYGDERLPALRKWMDESSALENVDRIRKPLLVLQGANDPRVPQSESDQIVAALKRTKTPVWYLVFRDEGHGFRKKVNADYAYYCTALFAQQYLLD